MFQRINTSTKTRVSIPDFLVLPSPKKFIFQTLAFRPLPRFALEVPPLHPHRILRLRSPSLNPSSPADQPIVECNQLLDRRIPEAIIILKHFLKLTSSDSFSSALS